MVLHCPTCGAALGDREFIVSLDRNAMVIDGRTFPLPPHLAEVASAIDAAMPRGLSLAELKDKLWGWQAAERSDRTLHLYLTRLRGILAYGGLTISGGKGVRLYRIVPVEGDGE